ncbi:MAG: glycosyltransferase [Eubacteriales bacterium]
MTQPVRVLMVLTVRFAKNGITNSVMNYVSRFDPARVRCDLACPNEPGDAARELIRRTGGEVFVLGGRNRNPIGYIRALGRIVRAREEEIVHAHGNSATLYVEMRAAKSGGAPISLPHSHNTTCKMKAADRLLRGLFDRSYTQAIACSRAAGEWLYHGRPFTVLNNAIDAERFRYNSDMRFEIRRQLGVATNEYVFLHVGAFNEQKHQAFLLEAFALAHKSRDGAKLLLVGDGPLRGDCETLARSLSIGDRVVFLGLRDDVPALLSAADAFVLPSLHEGLPLTLVEAQCAGLPCVVSDRVTHESAITKLVSFASIDRAESYAAAMEAVERVSRAEASDEAIRLVKETGFDVSTNAETLMRIYEDAHNTAGK